MDRQAKIELKELVIGYRQFKESNILLEKVSVKAEAGELVALMGNNGSGKSTLLRAITGLQPPLNGDIYVNGFSVRKTGKKLLSQFLAFVPTHAVYPGNINVFELVSTGKFAYSGWFGQLKNADQFEINRLISLVGLKGYNNRLVGSLSDGERQRAFIARALAQETPVIVLDEPTAYLDIKNRYEILHLLKELAHNFDKTILFSTHDFNLAINEVDKIWLVNKNDLLEGAPEDLVIGGWFKKLFSNENIEFDRYQGDFRIKRKNHRKVFLECDNELARVWIVKALERSGFEVSSCSRVKVSADSGNNIAVHINKKEIRVKSVYEMCKTLLANKLTDTGN